MSWRDRIKNTTASFRGVPFHMATNELGGGRRTVRHQFPFRDLPNHDDLGRKGRSFPIEGHVVGEDYLAQRDRLISALELRGPGELVLPLSRPMWVVVTDFRVRESTDELGMARFSISFEETTVAGLQPTSVVDAAGALRSSIDVARDASEASFLAVFKASSLRDSITDQLGRFSAQIRKFSGMAQSGVQERASFKLSLDRFSANIESLAIAPSDLLTGVTDLFGRMPSLAAIRAAYNFNPGVRPPARTPRRAVEQANFDALRALIQRTAVIRSVELAAATTYASYEDAVAARSRVADLLDEQADTAGDDVYLVLVQMRADLVRAVPAPSAKLAHLLPFTPAVTMPALALVHRLYGSVKNLEDLVARNRVRNPGFIPGGQELEVLSDER